MPKSKVTRVAQLIANRLRDLSASRSLEEIAAAAGLQSANLLGMMQTGAAKLSLDRVEPLAMALEMDVDELMLAALEQFFRPNEIARIRSATRPVRATVSSSSALMHAAALRIEVLGIREAAVKSEFAVQDLSSQIEETVRRVDKIATEFDELLDRLQAMSPTAS
jgi:uncharacterized coiled-coil protein SlyX